MDACKHCIRRWWAAKSDHEKGGWAIGAALLAMWLLAVVPLFLGWFD